MAARLSPDDVGSAHRCKRQLLVSDYVVSIVLVRDVNRTRVLVVV